MDAATGRVLGVRDIQRDPAAPRLMPLHAADGAGPVAGIRTRADQIQHGKPDRLDDQTRADRPGRVELVKDRDLVPVARCKHCGRKAADPGPGYGDFLSHASHLPHGARARKAARCRI